MAVHDLFQVGQGLQLAAATTLDDERTGRLHPQRRGIEDGPHFRPPEVLSALRNFGPDGLAGERPVDEDDAAVDPRDGGAPVGELPDLDLKHLLQFFS